MIVDFDKPRAATRHKPEDPLPTTADAAREWGLGFALGQAMAALEKAASVNAWSDPEALVWVKRTWGHLFNARLDAFSMRASGADTAPARSTTIERRQVVVGGSLRRSIAPHHIAEAWILPTGLARAVEHIERASRMQSPEGVIEAIDDALAALAGWIGGQS